MASQREAVGSEWEPPGVRRRPRRLWLLAAGLVAVGVAGVLVGVDDDEDAELPIDERDEPAGREDAEPPAGFGDEDNWRVHASFDSTQAVAPAPDGTVWMATTAAGLLHWDPDEDAWQRHVPAGIRRIAAVAVGSDGTVWAAAGGHEGAPVSQGRSPGSLARYDGQEWQHFSVGGDLPPIMARGVSSLAVDGAGNVWAAAADGVVRFDGDEWSLYRTDDGLPHGQVVSVLIDGDGAVWARTRHRPAEPVGDLAGGVARYDDGEWTAWTTDSGDLPLDKVTAVAAGADGNLWAVTRQRDRGGKRAERETALLRFQDRRWEVEVAGTGVLGEVGALAVDRDGKVWAATPTRPAALPEPAGGEVVVGRAEGGWAFERVTDGLENRHVRSLAAGRVGDVWAATERGVVRFHDEGWDRYVTKVGPAGDTVVSVVEDDDGAVWTATAGGVSRFDGDEWTTWTADDGLAADDATSLAVADDGAVWVGTAGGVSRFADGGWTSWTGEDGLGSDRVESLAVGGDGSVWAAVRTTRRRPADAGEVVEGGLARYDGTGWTSWSADELPGGFRPTSISVGGDGDLWAVLQAPRQPFTADDRPTGPPPTRVGRFDGDEWTTWNADDGLPHDFVTAVAASDNQTVWAATGRGVARFDGHTWATGDALGLDFADPARHEPVTALAANDGAAWVGTPESLHHFDDRKWTSTDTVAAPGAIEAGQHALWIGTTAGLARPER